MSTETPVPVDHPLRKAWDAYKARDTYSNTRRWALHEDHVDGSLWAAFAEGWEAATKGTNHE
jgi:hypothetical protein